MSPLPRLDALLVERGLVASRSQAAALIMAGEVSVAGERVTKAGTRLAPDSQITVAARPRFVSRAGEKLAGALAEFGLPVADRSCIDAGASTGGFTDVLLQGGARRVVSVDVGYGQLDWKLRTDERVTVIERTNVRYLSGADLPFPPELLVADLSFISLGVALERLMSTADSLREAVVLVKPQFEAGPGEVGRGGVVRDPEVHLQVISTVMDSFERIGYGAVQLTRAAVQGRRSGNQEYPLHLVRGTDTERPTEAAVREVVAR